MPLYLRNEPGAPRRCPPFEPQRARVGGATSSQSRQTSLQSQIGYKTHDAAPTTKQPKRDEKRMRTLSLQPLSPVTSFLFSLGQSSLCACGGSAATRILIKSVNEHLGTHPNNAHLLTAVVRDIGAIARVRSQQRRSHPRRRSRGLASKHVRRDFTAQASR